MADRPSILLVLSDQMVAALTGAYGHPVVRTPNLDRLAAGGVRFDAAYTPFPLCAPGRACMMTGRHASAIGAWDNGALLPADQPTFAHYLRLMGYRTCLSGKMHFVGPDQLHGFEERLTTDVYPADFGWVPDWTNPRERIDLWYHNMSSVKQAGVAAITNQLAYDDEVGAQSLKAIYDHARSEDERSLCLVASFIHPHDPYAVRQKYWDLYEDVDIQLPSVMRPPRDEQDPHNQRLEDAIAVDAVDISDATSAQRAVGELDTLITTVAAGRAKYGAYINRLEYASDNLMNVAQNTDASRSRIEDADYASETSELARTQIIAQASTAMLAQANQSKQSVLALLQ